MLALKSRIASFIEHRWYSRAGVLRCLLPLEYLFCRLASKRRKRQQQRAYQSKLPVIIVGNIAVGGTGKTPLLICLARYLQSQGYKPAIISRAYKSQAAQSASPILVDGDQSYRDIGDEPLEISLRTGLPVVVGADRISLVKFVETQTQCDVILADDGLQNYLLGRDIEVVVIDGSRGWGNGHCLPVGPLREPIARAAEADLCLVNGGGELSLSGKVLHRAAVKATQLINLLTQERQSVDQLKLLSPVVAIAGLGNPNKFFNTLSDLGIEFQSKTFMDHSEISPSDLLEFDDKAIIMTGKDAVKCREFAQANHWVLEVELRPDKAFLEELLQRLKRSEK